MRRKRLEGALASLKQAAEEAEYPWIDLSADRLLVEAQTPIDPESTTFQVVATCFKVINAIPARSDIKTATALQLEAVAKRAKEPTGTKTNSEEALLYGQVVKYQVQLHRIVMRDEYEKLMIDEFQKIDYIDLHTKNDLLPKYIDACHEYREKFSHVGFLPPRILAELSQQIERAIAYLDEYKASQKLENPEVEFIATSVELLNFLRRQVATRMAYLLIRAYDKHNQDVIPINDSLLAVCMHKDKMIKRTLGITEGKTNPSQAKLDLYSDSLHSELKHHVTLAKDDIPTEQKFVAYDKYTIAEYFAAYAQKYCDDPTYQPILAGIIEKWYRALGRLIHHNQQKQQHSFGKTVSNYMVGIFSGSRKTKAKASSSESLLESFITEREEKQSYDVIPDNPDATLGTSAADKIAEKIRALQLNQTLEELILKDIKQNATELSLYRLYAILAAPEWLNQEVKLIDHIKTNPELKPQVERAAKLLKAEFDAVGLGYYLTFHDVILKLLESDIYAKAHADAGASLSLQKTGAYMMNLLFRTSFQTKSNRGNYLELIISATILSPNAIYKDMKAYFECPEGQAKPESAISEYIDATPASGKSNDRDARHQFVFTLYELLRVTMDNHYIPSEKTRKFITATIAELKLDEKTNPTVVPGPSGYTPGS